MFTLGVIIGITVPLVVFIVVVTVCRGHTVPAKKSRHAGGGLGENPSAGRVCR